MGEKRIGADLFLDRVDFEFALGDRTDDAVVIARGLQKHRHRACHDDAVQDGLVTVAVHNHDVARRHGVVPDHLVAGAGAVGHEETMVSIENAGRIAFGRADGAIVIQQLAKLLHRVAHVGTQHVLAVELMVHLADRAFEKCHAARMARAMP